MSNQTNEEVKVGHGDIPSDVQMKPVSLGTNDLGAKVDPAATPKIGESSILNDPKGHYPSVKVAVIGNVDSGKSTLVGVLTKGGKDDGNGEARKKVFNYHHEIENGRTSSVAHEIMGFDEKGKQYIPERFNPNKNKYWAEVVSHTSRLVTLIDLCGHEKYLKTTMFGLVGLIPDYSMIIVGSNMGIQRMTKEHLGITIALKIPFFVVMTKIDMCPKHVFEETLDTLQRLLRSPVVGRKPIMIKEDSDVDLCAEGLSWDKICPIFCVSSVTLENMDRLTRFLYLLRPRHDQISVIKTAKHPVEFDIHETFMVTGVGLVISGIVKSGTIKTHQQLLLGPDKMRAFRSVIVRSIHVSRLAVEEAASGEFATLAIKPMDKGALTRADFRKGMVVIDPALKPTPIWEFEAEVVILHHATTIQTGYQAVVHCGVIRQAVNIQKMNAELLRTGDKGTVRFRFMYHPEYLQKGLTILLREGRTKILGTISSVFEG
eukprot:TRINITY_DN4485_c0_g3_i4.p1 TRINITY_DN4485_c0_g3~~TRINITY_DN4485_c0_g3_i4.p1  ORF type:complete len:487 (-),score=107.98 TRINITY_DN4485_c0_g3_i4:17-1477(-)